MAWNKANPPTSTALVSADHRADWSAIETALAGVNLLADPTFLIWPAGDALAPAHWVLSGAAAAIARAGTGLGDTSRKIGAFTAKVTAGGAAVAVLEQNLLPATGFDTGWQSGVSLSMGAWVRATAASAARLRITDGVNTSFSSFHTGGGAYEFLTIVGHSIAATATKLAAGMEVAISQVGYLSGPTVLFGQIPPATFMPAPVAYDNFTVEIAGVQTVGTNKFRCLSPRPLIVKDVQLLIRTTGPTGANLIVDVNTWDGAALTSMFSTRPQIVAAATLGAARPDSTYARRCMTGLFDASATTGSFLSCDVDQIGSGVAGTDLIVQIRYLYFERPLEAFLAYNDLN